MVFNEITVTDIKEPITVYFEKGKTTQMKDRRYFGISFCQSGRITYTMNGENYLSTPNCAVLLPKGATYSIYGNETGVFPVINFDAIGFELDHITVLTAENFVGSIKDCETIKSLFLNNNSRLEIYSVFYNLLNKTFATQLKKNKRITHIVRYIEENISNPNLTNTSLANYLGISEVYLRRLFRANCGTTPKQFILDARVRKAKQMLTESRCSVTDIAEQCGFGSVYHFCRAFKKDSGLTPTEYAEQNIIYKI
ncbi:MAG: helix-turn-helix transcriptional regulator [Clostridia bacterium]|nr:helix-turn-helix transcriptional regulator [Clostridia bacterium]